MIVAYRSRELVCACLRSLEEHPLSEGETRVDVVDNDSGDGTPEAIAQRFGHVRVLALDDNRGFSYANNLVLRGMSSPYALLLNPDTLMTAGALDRLVALLESDLRTGMVGPRLVLEDGSFDHAAKRSFPTPLSALGHFTGIGRRRDRGGPVSDYRAPGLGERERGDVEAVNGAFMLVRREALEDVGLLDEGYWLYMEDLDWCYRFHQRGWRIVYDGTTTVVHLKSATSGRHRRVRQNVAFHRGMGRFYRSHCAGSKPLLDLSVYAGIGVKLGLSLAQSAVARRRNGAH